MPSKNAKKKAKKRNRTNYRKYLKAHCERCGFVAEHSCQIDVHHIDGDRTNDKPENLASCCARCHRLECVGMLEPVGEWKYRSLEVEEEQTKEVPSNN